MECTLETLSTSKSLVVMVGVERCDETEWETCLINCSEIATSGVNRIVESVQCLTQHSKCNELIEIGAYGLFTWICCCANLFLML